MTVAAHRCRPTNPVDRLIFTTPTLRPTGLGVAVVRAFPANAALFLGYELAREILD